MTRHAHGLTRRSARSALALSLAGTVAGISACRTWRVEPLPRSVGGGSAPERTIRGPVRATRLDGWRVELTEARVANDTLRGPARARAADSGAVAVAVPLDSVRALHSRRFSAGRTAGLVGGILAAWFALAFAVLLSATAAY
jgi:hypothetical protein